MVGRSGDQASFSQSPTANLQGTVHAFGAKKCSQVTQVPKPLRRVCTCVCACLTPDGQSNVFETVDTAMCGPAGNAHCTLASFVVLPILAAFVLMVR
jgi:hypothetical protein